jgi:hypothetical protein
MTPQTLMEAVRYFSDPGVCHDYMRRVKWGDGPITCPKCGRCGGTGREGSKS